MEEIRGLLTRDSICRKIRQWKLLSTEEMSDMWSKTSLFRHEKTTDFNQFNCFVTSNSYITASLDIGEWTYIESIIIKLVTASPIVEDLLKEFY
jgi:hypothetical protein